MLKLAEIKTHLAEMISRIG